MNDYYLFRTGRSCQEHAVRVGEYGGRGMWVNPTEIVRRATGIHFARTGCVISFASGIESLGVRVTILDERDNGPGILYLHQNPYPNILVYWLAGRLWALGEWETFVRALEKNHIPMGVTRQRAMEATASFYMDEPSRRKLQIILPV